MLMQFPPEQRPGTAWHSSTSEREREDERRKKLLKRFLQLLLLHHMLLIQPKPQNDSQTDEKKEYKMNLLCSKNGACF